MVNNDLVGGFQPLWKIWKSMGRIVPYIMENKKHVKNISHVLVKNIWNPNHHPAISSYLLVDNYD